MAKKLFIIALLSILLLPCAYAQKVEVAVQANSGLFHYSGNGTTSTSFIDEGVNDKLNYTDNPYGNKNGFSYGGDVQAQYVSKSGFITGLQTGYEVLRSKEDIDEYNPILITIFTNGPGGFLIPVKGQIFLQDKDININPYIGHRLNLKKIKIDIMPGMDIGMNVNSYEKGSATATDGTVYKVDYKMLKPPTDVRLTLGLAASFKRFGLTAGYAYGLTNFAPDLVANAGGSSISAPKIHSELIRFGVSYRIF